MAREDFKRRFKVAYLLNESIGLFNPDDFEYILFVADYSSQQEAEEGLSIMEDLLIMKGEVNVVDPQLN